MNTKYYVAILIFALITLAKDDKVRIIMFDSLSEEDKRRSVEFHLRGHESNIAFKSILAKYKSRQEDTIHIIPVEEKCADLLNLYNFSTDSIGFGSLHTIWWFIFDNIPESCNAIFITEESYKILKAINRIKNNANVLFTDKVYSCENEGNEKKLDIALAKNCRINITTSIWPLDTLFINNRKYYLNDYGVGMMYD